MFQLESEDEGEDPDNIEVHEEYTLAKDTSDSGSD